MTYLYDGLSVDELFGAVNRAILNGLIPWYGADGNGRLLLFETEHEARSWMASEIENYEHQTERSEKFALTKVAMDYLGGERVELKLSPLYQEEEAVTSRIWRIWPYIKPAHKR